MASLVWAEREASFIWTMGTIRCQGLLLGPIEDAIMLPALIPALAPILGKVVGNLFPDPEEKARAQHEMTTQLLAHQSEIESAAASIIKTEAASKHWLAANWRPLTALVFVGLIVARWLGYTAPNMTEAEYLAVYDIIQIMIGGYVASRGVEKVAPGILSALKKS